MNRATTTKEYTALPTLESSDAPPPVWDEVPFDVTCARCGENLRGLVDPQCPRCRLTFDWSVAVPLDHLICVQCGYHLRGLREMCCPECGRAFTWNEVIEDHHRRSKPLFEYHWRTRPLASLWKTWKLGLMPWKLWRTVDIHDPPLTRILLLTLLIELIVFAVSLPVVYFVYDWTIALALLAWGRPAWAGGVSLWAPWRWGLAWYVPYVLTFVAWGVGGLGALLILRQSMKQCRVRNGHVFRAFVYSIIPVASLHLIYGPLVTVMDVCAITFPAWEGHPVGDVLAKHLNLSFWLMTVISIALAYRYYLRMRHAWAVAISTQIIAAMFALCVNLLAFTL